MILHVQKEIDFLCVCSFLFICMKSKDVRQSFDQKTHQFLLGANSFNQYDGVLGPHHKIFVKLRD